MSDVYDGARDFFSADNEYVRSNDYYVRADELTMHFPARKDNFGRVSSWIHGADKVSFEVPRGKTMGVVGESGCGKSTVGKMLVGMYKPTSGRIIYDGKDITDLSLKERLHYQRRIQMVWQDPYSSLDPRMQVGEIIGETIRNFRLASSPEGKNMSARNITLSTSGIPENIRRFALEGLPVTLALSLHASNDEDRKALMPIARKYSIEEVLCSCDDYFQKTGRRVTYEYAVISGENDTEKNVRELKELLGGRMAHINLIPVNPVREKMMKRPTGARSKHFKTPLKNAGYMLQ